MCKLAVSLQHAIHMEGSTELKLKIVLGKCRLIGINRDTLLKSYTYIYIYIYIRFRYIF